MKSLTLLFFIPLLALACSTTKNAEVEWVPYSSPNYAVSFMVPSEWAVADNADSITVASADELLFASSINNGARLNMTITPSFFAGSEKSADMIETAVRSFRNQAGTEIIQEIRSTTVGEQLAVETVLCGPDAQGQEIILRYLVIENFSTNQTAVVAAVHDAARENDFGPLLEGIVNSVQLGEPAVDP